MLSFDFHVNIFLKFTYLMLLVWQLVG